MVTVPVVAITGVSNGASYPLGSVPAAGCSTNDALSGVATQATLSGTGGKPDGTVSGTDHIALFQFTGKARSTGESDTESSEAMVPRVFLPQVNG